MSKHQAIQALLAHYDELDAATRQQVEEHLASCPTCAATRTAYQLADQQLRDWATQQEATLRGQGLASTLRSSRVGHLSQPATHARGRHPLAYLRAPLLQTAGAALLLLLLTFLLLSFSSWLPLAAPVRAATPTVNSPLVVPTLTQTPSAFDGP
ncbi:MAG: zf-HC2 domain-containing protein [Caldilineaceae bacterium]|nr:zf-HC2 domain-containing protein [Caldilineaceae bacterium]